MKVHISGTSTHIDEDIEFLRAMFRAVHNSKALVTREWLEITHSQYQKYTDEQLDWRMINQENIEALERSDIVIADVTRSHLYQGYQVFIAAQRKKPTLVVTRSPIKGHFISGIANKYVTLKAYKTVDELETIITQFIKSNTIPTKDLRFNFMINRAIYKYLRNKSYETGKNKSEIIRELLEREIIRRNR